MSASRRTWIAGIAALLLALAAAASYAQTRQRQTAPNQGGPLDVIAIDNLPSLLPLEASESFSADLTTQLLNLVDPVAGY